MTVWLVEHRELMVGKQEPSHAIQGWNTSFQKYKKPGGAAIKGRGYFGLTILSWFKLLISCLPFRPLAEHTNSPAVIH